MKGRIVIRNIETKDVETKDVAIELKRSLQGARPYGTSESGVLYPELSYSIVGALIEVHRWLGPGQLEGVYQRAVEKELGLRKIPFVPQVSMPARYKGDVMGELVLDVIVDDAIVLELKAVERLIPVHRAQLISYLHASDCRLGMLVNFHVPVMIEGIKRIAL